MSKSPAFQFYPADFLADANVAVMTTEEVGAYLILTLFAWRENGLPDDVEELAALARMPHERFAQSWERRLARCFERREDGRLVHPRLELEREKQQAFREKMSEVGKRGGRPKKGEKKGSKRVGKGEANPDRDKDSKPLLSSIFSTPVGAAPDFTNWPRTYGEAWLAARKGTAPFARIGSALKPLVERDGAESHWAAWMRFVSSDKARFGPEYFANNRSDFDPPPVRLAMTSAGLPVMSPAEHEAYKRAEIEAINEHRMARGEAPLVA
jgi:uncharacterized protein YdaU (DUF1376 family)